MFVKEITFERLIPGTALLYRYTVRPLCSVHKLDLERPGLFCLENPS